MISLMGPTAWTATCKSRTASSLKDVRFIQYWSGRIGMTRDLLPTVLREPASPWVYRVLGCVGLPWATFCGDFAARQALAQAETGDGRYFGYFDVNRRFLVPIWLEKIMGKRLAFPLNNAWGKYYEKDSRVPEEALKGAPSPSPSS